MATRMKPDDSFKPDPLRGPARFRRQAPMAAIRIFSVASSLILPAIGIATGACAVLFAFPRNLLVWQIGSWTLVIALFSLLALVLASAYSLATNRAARTWQRIGSFLLGLACLVAVAVASF